MKRGSFSLRRGGLLLVAAVAAIGPLLAASAAHADPPKEVSSNPADGSTVAISPPNLTITFDQSIGSAASVVIACNGNPASVPPPRVSDDPKSLVVDLATTPLPKGQCRVSWQVQGTAEPGTTRGQFSFTVQQDTLVTTAPSASAAPADSATVASSAAGSGAASGQTNSNGESGSSSNVGGPLGLARLLSTLTIAVLFGSLVLITYAWPEGIEYILTIRFLRYTWIIAVLSTALLVVCLSAEATGKSIGSSLSPSGWFDLKDTTPGIAALARLVFVVMSGWVAMRPERCIDPATQLPALAIPGLAVATLGFDRTGGNLELIGYGAGALHALAMAVWLGGLIILARVVLAGPGEEDLVHAVRGFGRLATPALVVTVVTGGILVYRLDSGHLFNTTHGRLVLLKVIAVIAMVFVGVTTRQWANTHLGRADVMTAPTAGRLRRAVGMEAVIGVVVLAITAWMMSTQPGNLKPEGRSSSSFAFQYVFQDAEGKLDVKLSVNPARVGINELLIEVTKPENDINSIEFLFEPPTGTSGGVPVKLTVTNLPGVGGAYLPLSEGIPLNLPGAWNVTLTLVSADGSFKQSTFMTVGSVDDGEIASIPTVTSPIVTSPAAESTTTTVPG